MVWGVFAAKRDGLNVIRVGTESPRVFSNKVFVSDKAFFFFFIPRPLRNFGFVTVPESFKCNFL